MFDIGFLELVLISVISLVVLGPERLPGAIRTVSLWIGRLRRSFNTIKQDIEREIGADDIRRQLRNEAIMDKFKQTKAQVNEAIRAAGTTAEELRKASELEAMTVATSDPFFKPKAEQNSNPATDAPAGTPAPVQASAPDAAPVQEEAAAPEKAQS